MSIWSDATAHFRVLEARRVYLEGVIEKFGPNKYKLAEASALAFVLDALAESPEYVEDVLAARKLVDERPPVVK